MTSEKSSAEGDFFVLSLPFVKSCLKHLRERPAHRHFAGYLCICEASALAQRTVNLKPSFKDFFERFLLVGGAPEESPYLVPFNEAGTLDASVWMNRNIAGSYAPSSIRSQAPLRRVVDVFGAGREAAYSLKDNHEELCTTHLLSGRRIDALALAGFLFRDYSFSVPSGERLTPAVLRDALYSRFGFGDGGFERADVFDGASSPVEALLECEQVSEQHDAV